MIGKNTPSATQIRSFVDRVEQVEKDQKALSEDKSAIYSEAKSAGFDTKAIRRLVRRRKFRPHDVQEADAMDDLYRHAVGMDNEPPLFRQIEGICRDFAGGDKLLEAFKLLVPESGDIIITLKGKRYRIWRDKSGTPISEDYVEASQAKKPHGRSTLPPQEERDVPDCDADGAEALGMQAAKDNKPVIDNPFPHDDARRPRWDLGWRKGMGNDGMEPDED